MLERGRTCWRGVELAGEGSSLLERGRTCWRGVELTGEGSSLLERGRTCLRGAELAGFSGKHRLQDNHSASLETDLSTCEDLLIMSSKHYNVY